MLKRNIHTYEVWQGRKKVHAGITNDPDRRLTEHQAIWPGCRLKLVGRVKTESGARDWEAKQPKRLTDMP
jgi:hypothetical protein